jgi:hypothetical protein
VSVPIPCLCPPTGEGEVRHPDGDTVELRDTLGFVQARAIREDAHYLKQIDPDVSIGEILATLTTGYIVHGVTGWSLVDAKGKPLDCTRANIRAVLLANDEAADLVGDAADELYAGKVMLPLLRGVSTSSPVTPTASRSSTRKDSGPSNRRQSSPSSISTIPTAAITTTSKSRGGDSRSSQSSGRVA